MVLAAFLSDDGDFLHETMPVLSIETRQTDDGHTEHDALVVDIDGALCTLEVLESLADRNYEAYRLVATPWSYDQDELRLAREVEAMKARLWARVSALPGSSIAVVDRPTTYANGSA